jgi:hypothetical protein
MTGDLSPSESALAGLGRRVAVHEANFAAGGWLWYVGAISLLSGVAWLVAPAKTLGASHGVPTRPVERLFMAIVALVVGAACTFVATYRWKQTVEIYERGFVWRRLSGPVIVHRSEMVSANKEVWQSRLVTVVSVVVALRDERELTLRGFPDPDKLESDLRALASLKE